MKRMILTGAASLVLGLGSLSGPTAVSHVLAQPSGLGGWSQARPSGPAGAGTGDTSRIPPGSTGLYHTGTTGPAGGGTGQTSRIPPRSVDHPGYGTTGSTSSASAPSAPSARKGWPTRKTTHRVAHPNSGGSSSPTSTAVPPHS